MRIVLVLALLVVGCSPAEAAPSGTPRPLTLCQPAATGYHRGTLRPDCFDPWLLPPSRPCIMPAPGEPVPDCMRP